MNIFRRLRLLVVALIVALLNAGTPVLAYATMARDGGLTQEICSPSGARKIVVDADGSAREVAVDAGHGDHCQLCASAGATPVATLIDFHHSAIHQGAVRVGQTCVQSGNALTTPPATGPPPNS